MLVETRGRRKIHRSHRLAPEGRTRAASGIDGKAGIGTGTDVEQSRRNPPRQQQQKAIAGEGLARGCQAVRAAEVRGDFLRHVYSAGDEQRLQIQRIHGLTVEIEKGR